MVYKWMDQMTGDGLLKPRDCYEIIFDDLINTPGGNTSVRNKRRMQVEFWDRQREANKVKIPLKVRKRLDRYYAEHPL